MNIFQRITGKSAKIEPSASQPTTQQSQPLQSSHSPKVKNITVKKGIVSRTWNFLSNIKSWFSAPKVAPASHDLSDITRVQPTVSQSTISDSAPPLHHYLQSMISTPNGSPSIIERELQSELSEKKFKKAQKTLTPFLAHINDSIHSNTPLSLNDLQELRANTKIFDDEFGLLSTGVMLDQLDKHIEKTQANNNLNSFIYSQADLSGEIARDLCRHVASGKLQLTSTTASFTAQKGTNAENIQQLISLFNTLFELDPAISPEQQQTLKTQLSASLHADTLAHCLSEFMENHLDKQSLTYQSLVLTHQAIPASADMFLRSKAPQPYGLQGGFSALQLDLSNLTHPSVRWDYEGLLFNPDDVNSEAAVKDIAIATAKATINRSLDYKNSSFTAADTHYQATFHPKKPLDYDTITTYLTAYEDILTKDQIAQLNYQQLQEVNKLLIQQLSDLGFVSEADLKPTIPTAKKTFGMSSAKQWFFGRSKNKIRKQLERANVLFHDQSQPPHIKCASLQRVLSEINSYTARHSLTPELDQLKNTITDSIIKLYDDHAADFIKMCQDELNHLGPTDDPFEPLNHLAKANDLTPLVFKNIGPEIYLRCLAKALDQGHDFRTVHQNFLAATAMDLSVIDAEERVITESMLLPYVQTKELQEELTDLKALQPYLTLISDLNGFFGFVKDLKSTYNPNKVSESEDDFINKQTKIFKEKLTQQHRDLFPDTELVLNASQIGKYQLAALNLCHTPKSILKLIDQKLDGYFIGFQEDGVYKFDRNISEEKRYQKMVAELSDFQNEIKSSTIDDTLKTLAVDQLQEHLDQSKEFRAAYTHQHDSE
ncbi:hypothetical protein DID76_04355 [Candidatus Marinamargulisbacteria bacterium SCGC AG-414-C22]|nr:hypothetical protein DID76_04355 [Candidatus Marinamargulisbacteria bacterium SCGC AG-414-C22]